MFTCGDFDVDTTYASRARERTVLFSSWEWDTVQIADQSALLS